MWVTTESVSVFCLSVWRMVVAGVYYFIIYIVELFCITILLLLLVLI